MSTKKTNNYSDFFIAYTIKSIYFWGERVEVMGTVLNGVMSENRRIHPWDPQVQIPLSYRADHRGSANSWTPLFKPAGLSVTGWDWTGKKIGVFMSSICFDSVHLPLGTLSALQSLVACEKAQTMSLKISIRNNHTTQQTKHIKQMFTWSPLVYILRVILPVPKQPSISESVTLV